MKVNLPVTGREKDYSDQITIVSTTDRKGIITGADKDFCEVSEFTLDELIKKNHNVIRHPDMPPAAFDDLWKTLKAGKSWIGIVKNRCKSGDHYWVDAFVGPIFREGQVTGYQSVRVRPARELVERAEKIYQRVNAGKMGKHGFEGIGYANRIFVTMAACCLPVYGVAALLGGASLGAVLIGSVAGLVAVGIASRVVARPVVKAAQAARAVTDNAIARLVYTGRTDEIGQLQLALHMQEAKLRTLMGRVKVSTSELSGVAAGSAVAVEQSQAAVEAQRTETEHLAVAINEMATTVQDVARNTAEAAAAAAAAERESANIEQIVNKTIGAIKQLEGEIRHVSEVIRSLEDDSKRIGTVVDVIRGIAEQTNLLALNAAIEAARAGEQGRGFAVVADEVRALASRTAESTRQIQTMIAQLQTGTDTAVASMGKALESASVGVDCVGHSNESLQAITRSIASISDMNTQVATATEEQSAVANEINANIHSINIAVKESAAVLEQTAAMTRRLSEMSESLQDVVNQCEL